MFRRADLEEVAERVLFVARLADVFWLQPACFAMIIGLLAGLLR